VGWFGLRRGWVLIIFWTAVLAIAIVLRAVGVFGPNTFF
jgi:hypothetical protein